MDDQPLTERENEIIEAAWQRHVAAGVAGVFANAEIAFEGRRNGMNEPDPRGSYVALSVAKDGGGPPVLVKVSVAQAITLGRVLLENT